MYLHTGGCPGTTAHALETEEIKFFQNEIFHASKVGEVVIFKSASVLRIAWFLYNSMYLHTGGCPGTTVNASETEKIKFFFKMRLIMQVRLLWLSFL